MRHLTICVTVSLTAILLTNGLCADPLQDQYSVWFTPNIACVDMLEMFTAPEEWNLARDRIDVFKFYTVQVGSGGWSCVGHPAYNCGDNHLENFVIVDAFSKLGQWGIDIAVESFFAGPIMSYDPVECSTAEYIYNLTLDGSINVIQNIEANGGVVRYLAMDEPLRRWIPEYYYSYWGATDPRPCLADSIGEIADHIAVYILQMQVWFPSVQIGHIELYPEVGVDQFKEWIIALETRGVTLPFLHLDVNGPRIDLYNAYGMNIDLLADLEELKSFLEARGIAFGIIFSDIYWNSQAWEEDVYNDQFYYERTMEWVDFVEAANTEPSHYIFQSWVFPVYTTGYGPNEIPDALPEDDPSIYSHTRLVNEALVTLVGIEMGPSDSLPAGFRLHQNYPNPFNPRTSIRYELSEASRVTLKIYDVQGRLVKTLVSAFQEPGSYSVDFRTRGLSSGVYLYSLEVGDRFVETRKMILLK